MVEFKETRRQTGIQKKHSTGQKRRGRQRISWDKFLTNLEHEIHRAQHKVHKIYKQISKDVKETARAQGNRDEKVMRQYYEELWNTTNTLNYN
jgi:ketosteroid isomerase-like protein